jgi:hypothetical protein
MCPLCLTSLAVTVTASTSAGAAAIAAATRVARTLGRPPADGAPPSTPTAERGAQPAGGSR